MKSILPIFLLFSILGCKQKEINNPTVKGVNDILCDSKQLYDSLNDNGIDTNSYIGYNIYNDTSIYLWNEKHISNFYVNHQNFRIINTIDGKSKCADYLKLEQKIEGKWQIPKNIIERNLYFDFINFYDVNNDGFKDLALERRYNNEIIFYNPKKNKFNDTLSSVSVSPIFKLIDSSLNIFCDSYNYKCMRGRVGSTLYKMEGESKIDLFKIDFEGPMTKDSSMLFDTLINKFVLYKFKSNIEYDLDSLKTFPLKPTKEPFDAIDNFDYVSFWKRNYKGLLKIY